MNPPMLPRITVQKTTAADASSASDLQLLLETTGVGMWRYDGATRTFTLDATCRRLFDLRDDEELNLETIRQRIHPDDLESYRAAVTEAMQNRFYSVDYRVVHRDGSVRFISSRGRVSLDGPGGTPRVRGVCIDVTERWRLEERLRTTEERLQYVADELPGLLSYLDRDFRVQFMSSHYRRIFGRPGQELIGRHIRELVDEEEFLQRKPRYDRALAGEIVKHESARAGPDGTERYYTITHVPHRDHTGQVQGVLTLAIDITERRLAEQNLQRKTKELERSNRDLEQFAYVASHDLKAPLRAIEVLVQWLREDLKDVQTGEVQENLNLLQQRTQRLNRLLDDLLEYSRAGRKIGECERVDTRQLVQDIVTLLAPPPTMQVIADESMPVIETHSAPLEQVLRNLINNAIKHHPSRQGRVRVSASQQPDQILFAVEDDGAGIPEEYADKVFQMFQTLQPRDEREGSGMGLAIVKRIIEWQGGRIWFHPGANGRGTVFKFTWRHASSPANSLTEDSLEHLAG